VQISRPQLAVYVAAALAVALIGAKYLHDAGGGEAAPPARAQRAPAAVRVSGGDEGFATVHVAGEVRRPGVYRLRASNRVDDAVREAGGATRRGDLSGLNLAAKVEDGRQVLVPARAARGSAGGGGSGAAAGIGAAAGAPGSPPTQPVNINTATVAELDALDGIGPATAQKIVEYREQHGGFRNVAELDQVPGIGEGRMAALKDKVRV